MASKLLAFLALAAELRPALATVLPPRANAKPQACRKTKVAVLGAGISGITAAQALSGAGVDDFLILEHNDYIGGRVHHTTFGAKPDGSPYTVELGANWIEGVGGTGPVKNPILEATDKAKIKSVFSNYSAIVSYDHTGANDYLHLLDDTKRVVVRDRDGGCVEAEYAICTFSVGVLQNDVVEFQPRLPVWKREAIEQFQMGTYTKIFMQFNESFWPQDAQFLLYADEDERGWYPAFRAEQQTDEETKGQILTVLRKMFPDATVPEPTAFMYPRWGQEEWAFGSYSNWPVGMTLTKHQNLRANVGRLWFAGEANSAKYYGFMHGAYYEGKDAGERVAAMVRGEPIINEDTAPDGQLKRYEKLYGPVNMNEYNEGNGWPDDE
ncbi:hypothetical protein VdG1_07881 [Verticillium dahliae VDG1]|nr:hypothetical protein VdG1_07881 [Verticillium dahliae VDG1]